MKTGSTAFPGIVSASGALLIESRLLEQLADLMHNTAFFIKDTSGRYVVVNQSLVERHGLADKSRMISRRPCDVCPGDYGRIPFEQDTQVPRNGRPIIGGQAAFLDCKRRLKSFGRGSCQELLPDPCL